MFHLNLSVFVMFPCMCCWRISAIVHVCVHVDIFVDVYHYFSLMFMYSFCVCVFCVCMRIWMFVRFFFVNEKFVLRVYVFMCLCDCVLVCLCDDVR